MKAGDPITLDSVRVGTIIQVDGDSVLIDLDPAVFGGQLASASNYSIEAKDE